jgi:glycosyltransferase involved in cell wall biosynthesis
MVEPLVSVVVPTYYRNGRLRETLESVLGQAYDRVELIVVDDSGERHAEPVAEEFADALTYVAHSRNRGAHAARDAGLERASGRYVQFLDDDDRLRPRKIAAQVDLLERSPDVGVAYCGLEMEDGTVHLPDPSVRGDVLRDALGFYDHPLTTSTMLIDRAVLEEVLPLARDSPGADDINLCIRLAQVTAFDFVDEVLVVGGLPARSRGRSWGGVRGRREILRRYRDLYDEFDPAVRRRALAEVYRQEGRRRLEDRVWSARAILAFLRSLRYEPDRSPVHVGECLASLFGRPGRTLAAELLAATRR